jgi:hypothetical protein
MAPMTMSISVASPARNSSARTMKGNAAGMVILPWLVSLGAGYVESRWGIQVPAEVQVAVATTILGVAKRPPARAKMGRNV